MANPFDEIDPPAAAAAKVAAAPSMGASPKNPFDEIDPRGASPSSSPSSDSLNWSDVPGKAIQNLPQSAYKFGEDLVQPVIHPVETAKSLGRLALGTVEKFLPGDWEHEKYADAVGLHFKEKYGSEAGFKKAIAEDPVGVMSDMSIVLGGVGGLTAKAGKLSNLSKVSRAGEVVGDVGRAIDPVMAPIHVAKAGSEIVGGLGTHTGAGPLREAYRTGVEGGEAGKTFRDEMRGSADMTDVIDTARQGMGGLYREKADRYMRDMAPVNADYHMLDFTGVDNALSNVSSVKKFKGVDINRKTAEIRGEINALIDEWRGYAPAQYHTPAGFDALKQAIGDIMDHTQPGTPARRVAREAYNAVKQEIVKQAPEYAKAMKNYENAMGTIREMEQTLSLKQGANIDTTLRKLQSIMRNNVNTNYGRRMELGKMLEEAGAEHLMARLAGQTLNTWTPRGLGKVAAEIGLLGAGAHAASFPWAAAALPFMSPRLMGEATHATGRTAGRVLNKTGETLGKVGLTNRAAGDLAYEAGRTADRMQPPPEPKRPRVVMNTTEWDKNKGYAAGGAVHNHSPTEAQKQAGNYAKTHKFFQGLDITLENLKGHARSGIGRNGKKWSVKMPADYGYIKRTEGADGDHVDVYLGPNKDSDQVFVVDQKDAETGKFDEHKCLLGFSNEAEARRTYRAGFSDGKDRIKNIRRMSMPEFKGWLEKGDTSREVRHYAKGGAVRVALKALKKYADGGDVEEEPADHGLSERKKLSPLEKAISPVTRYPEVYSRMNREGREQIAHGYDQLGKGPLNSAMGVGNMALGAFDYLASPVNAAYRTVVGQPIEDVTGLPREHTELIAQLATPGIGFARMPVRKASGGPLSNIMKIVEGAMDSSAARRAASEEAAVALKSREVPPTSEVPKGVPDEPPSAAGVVPEAAAAEPAAATAAGDVGPGGGGAIGAPSLSEAQGAAARWAGERQPLEGIPGPLKIGENHFVPGPIGKIHDVAEEYMRTVHPDRPYSPPTKYHPLDAEHSKAIAQAYEEMKHTPNDPATKASYDALIDETVKQYDAIKATGLKIEPIPAGMPDPYAANPRMAAHDVAENNHLWFFPTEGGFGTVNKITDNPMLRPTGEKIGDHDLLANDMFRIVHDYFGHLKQGHGFRAGGEDNAWRTHSAMYSDVARPAMMTETRGQNSWVNYGPHGEKNRSASAADTTYADQKVGLLPEWVMRDRDSRPPLMVYHGTPHSFDRFNINKIGTGEGNQAYGHGLYFAGHEPVSEWYRHQLATRSDPLLKKYKLQEVGHVIGSHLSDAGGDAAKLAEEYAALQYNLIHNGSDDKATKNLIKDYSRRIDYLNDPKRSKGHLYQAGIDVDPAKLLDHDIPFKEQSQHVQGRVGPEMERSVKNQVDAIKTTLERGTYANHPAFQGQGWRKSGDRPLLPGVKAGLEGRLLALEQAGHTSFPGKEIYKRVGLPAKNESEGAVNASRRLLGMDIPGMRYLNSGSRGSGEGSHNYVMFGDEPVRILRKYDDGGRIAGIAKAGGGSLSGLLRGFESMMEAAPARKAMEEVGSAATEARPGRRYAEPEYAPSGRMITDKGVENPPDPTVQTVADPHRMMYPGVYRNPREIAEEAAAAVGPEDPALKRLFGVTRGEMREMAQGRVGNETPSIHGGGERSRGSLAAQNIQTPQNTQRLLDILHEAGKHEGLRTADAWYIMDPAYRRMVELHGPEAADRYRRFNTLTGMASPSTDVVKEIKRGTAANWLNEQGRFDDFRKYAGIPEEMRGRVQFPDDMRAVPGHAYHMTAHTGPMSKYLEKGFIDSKKAKVPLYVHASGVPETGFQTIGPVGDAHFSRGVGLADTRKGPSNVGGSFSSPEYHTLQPWWQHEVAGKAGLESVPAQARLWTALGPQTGVESALGAPKLELLAQQIMEASRRLRISPEAARDLVLSGRAGAFMRGGTVSGIHAIAV